MQHHPIFEDSTSPLTRSNDGRMEVRPERNPKGWTVVDRTDNHVELFTQKREIADAFVAGYDYRERLNHEQPPLGSHASGYTRV